MKISLINYTLVALILMGCGNLITDVDGPKVEPKLVLFSVITPEADTLVVRVHKSLPLNEPSAGAYLNYPPVMDARVEIKNAAASVLLQFDNRKMAYVASASAMPILPGATYQLHVVAPGGYEARAECTVPTQLPNPLEVTSVIRYPSNGWFEQRALNLRLADLPGKGHFYYVDVARAFRPSNPGAPPAGFDMIGFETGENYLTDANKEGSYFLFRTFEFDLWSTSDTLVLYSALTDVHFFKYHHSLMLYENNPFGEPNPVYTNVIGGLGLFAACRERHETYVLN